MGSDFLFAVPSFMSGLARTLDLGGIFTSYNDSANGEAADKRALSSDWKIVGDDLIEASQQFGQEQHQDPSQLTLALGQE
jgi:hypothetical protein